MLLPREAITKLTVLVDAAEIASSTDYRAAGCLVFFAAACVESSRRAVDISHREWYLLRRVCLSQAAWQCAACTADNFLRQLQCASMDIVIVDTNFLVRSVTLEITDGKELGPSGWAY